MIETDKNSCPLQIKMLKTLYILRNFSSNPAVKTPHSQGKGHGFDPWLEN